MTGKLEYAYETWIRASATEVWRALTDAAFTSQYFHATHVESTWEPGASVCYRYAPGGDVAVEGQVLEARVPERLVITWHVRYDEEAIEEAPSKVAFELDERADQTRLRISHYDFPAASVVYAGISEGWPWIISSLKSLLETGQPLPLAEAS